MPDRKARFVDKPPRLILSAALALSVMVAGCGTSPASNATSSTRGEAKTSQPGRPEVNIYVDQAALRSPYAVLNGTVENAGGNTLSRLVVEVELKRRGSDARETRDAAVEPQTLAPGEKGKYSLKVMSQEWGDFRVTRLKSLDGPEEIAFTRLPGAPRAPERVDATRTVKGEAPRKPPQAADDFINTPDTPVAVP